MYLNATIELNNLYPKDRLIISSAIIDYQHHYVGITNINKLIRSKQIVKNLDNKGLYIKLNYKDVAMIVVALQDFLHKKKHSLDSKLIPNIDKILDQLTSEL